MKLTWYGHACFLAETAAGSIVFDPYSPGSVPGLTLPPLKADAVHCSHGHGDHCYTDGVTLSGNFFDIIKNIVAVGNEYYNPFSSYQVPALAISELAVSN